MSFTDGYNFTPNTFGRAGEVNSNFAWFRGHFLPVTQSGTLAQTSALYDIGSATKNFRDGYFSGSISCAELTVSGLITAGSISCIKLSCSTFFATQGLFSGSLTVGQLKVNDNASATPNKVTLYADSIIKGMAKIDNAGTTTQSLVADIGVNSISLPATGVCRITWDNSFTTADDNNIHVTAFRNSSAQLVLPNVATTLALSVDIVIQKTTTSATAANILVLALGKQ